MSNLTEALREVACLMRERAEAATPSPWQRFTTSDSRAIGGLAPAVLSVPLDEAGELDAEISRCIEEPDAEHIASWHPAVALAVADWLDAIASRFPKRLREFEEHLLDREQSCALAVARAYWPEDVR